MTSLMTLVSTLVASGGVLAYVLYGMTRMPAGLLQQDQLIGQFARWRLVLGLSVAGDELGLGHLVDNVRIISSKLMPSGLPPNYTGLNVYNATFDGVPVRVYEPLSRSPSGPAIVYIHGGGWVFGDIDSCEPITTTLSRRLGVVVVSVGYRLAPDHPFPVPFDDCHRATLHMMRHAATYGVDPARITVAGLSSGANLAAAVALALRTHVPPLANQVLIVPCLQALDFRTPSYQENRNDNSLPRYLMVDFWLWYALGREGHRLTAALTANDHTSADAKRRLARTLVPHGLVPRRHVHQSYAPNDDNYGNETLWAELRETLMNSSYAPLMEADLGGLSPAFVATTQYDVLRDDGIIYAKRMAKAGVRVRHEHYDGAFHSSLYYYQVIDVSKRMLDDLLQYLAANL